MTESVVADFVARFVVGRQAGSEPTRGRVVMSPKRVVLAGDSGKTTIPVAAIQDIGIGRVSEDVSPYFDDTVTIAFQRDDRSVVGTIEADRDAIERFSTILFKSLLAGRTTTIRHPVAMGGRRTDTGTDSGTLRLTADSASVENTAGNEFMVIDRDAVIRIDKLTRLSAESADSVLAVWHDHGGTMVRTDLSLDSQRHLSLLSRFLSLGVTRRETDSADVQLSEASLKTLCALYADRSVSLENVLVDGHSPEQVLEPLREHGLITQTDQGPSPTLSGWVLLFDRVDEILN